MSRGETKKMSFSINGKFEMKLALAATDKLHDLDLLSLK